MDIRKWLELQNGSDIRGIATEGVPGEKVNLAPWIIHAIARSFVNWLATKTNKPVRTLKIAVGRDSRISGPSLMESFISGITAMGAQAVDCGIASTPAMYMATIFEVTRYDGSAMLTASHLPFNRNGIKFFTCDGGLNKPDITDILTMASGSNEPLAMSGTVTSFELIDTYADFLVQKIRRDVNHPHHYQEPLTGFHIVVDAGNGAGGFFAAKVLQPLGANSLGSQFLDPDGMFPNHVPNPEDETAMEFIQKAVLHNKADLGIIFDTDVDRAAAVDHQGKSINRNNLIALIASIILEEHPGTTIVTDSITSEGLSHFIERDLKGFHHRFKRGYKNVINESVRLNQEDQPSWLAIETSGHAALKENHFLDDGAYLITKILIKAAQLKLKDNSKILNLIANLHEPLESREFRLKIQLPDFKAMGNTLILDLEKYVATIPGWRLIPDNYEGIRVSVDESNGKGWFLMRLSLHDPVIPINIESNVKGGVTVMAQKLFVFLKKYQNLDCSAVEKFLK